MTIRFLVLLPLLTGCCTPPQSGTVPPPAVADGIQAEIKSMTRSGSPEVLEVEFELKRVSTDHWLLGPTMPVQVRFWTGSGLLITVADENGQSMPLSDDFVDRRSSTATSTLLAPIPRDARFVTVRVGETGLETARIKLPPRAM